MAGAHRAGAQTQIDLANQARNLDFSKRSAVLFRSGTNLPATCSPGEGYLKTDASPGANFYVCLTANNWTAQASGNAMVNPEAYGVPRAGLDGKLAQGWIDFTGYQPSLGYSPLNPASNLSDLNSATAARANLGLGAAALKSVKGNGASVAAFGGGLSTPYNCVMFDASGNLVDAGTACGGGAAQAAAYSQTFSQQTSVTLAHNGNTLAVALQCFDSGESLLIPNSATLPDANSAVVTFATAQSGRCVVQSGGAAAGGGGTGPSSFAQLSGTAAITQGGTGQTSKAAAFDALSPNTAKGDITVFDGSTNIRVAAGADGSCWVADASRPAGVKWGSCGGVNPGAGLMLAGNTLSIDAAAVPAFLSGTASLTFPSIGAGSCAVQAFAMTGAATGDAVAPGWPSSLEGGLVGLMRVSAANTVEVRLCNYSGSALTPAAGQTFRSTILRSF